MSEQTEAIREQSCPLCKTTLVNGFCPKGHGYGCASRELTQTEFDNYMAFGEHAITTKPEDKR